MTFKVDEKLEERLGELGATYRCIAQARQSRFKVEIIDRVTGMVFGEGEGESKQRALADAISKTSPEDKPKTPAQLAAENAELKRQLAAMRNPEIKVEGKPTRKVVDKPRINSVTGKKVAVGDGEG